MLCCIPHMATLSVIVRVMKEIKRAQRVPQAPVHLVTARASLFTDQKNVKSSNSVPNTSISRQSVRIILTIFQPIPVPPSWSDGHPSEALRLCTTVLSYYSPIHKIFQRTFPRDLPYRMTMRQFLRQVSPTVVFVQLLS